MFALIRFLDAFNKKEYTVPVKDIKDFNPANEENFNRNIRITNEDDSDGARYLAPVDSEPIVRLLQPMVTGKEEPLYDYYDLLLRTVRLVLEVHHEQRQGFSMLRAELESRLAPRDQQAHAAPAPLPDLPTLPATSLEELEAAEAALENEDRDQLARLGGKGLREVAVNVLTAIMGTGVQRLFSMHGKKGKRAFAPLRLCRVATGNWFSVVV
ncbi:hypothetical protein HPB50_028490 [Hyalomma asiaticum]|nr:hypothetical protein HPB50_028490 [Hyalomma asiaticum]